MGILASVQSAWVGDTAQGEEVLYWQGVGTDTQKLTHAELKAVPSRGRNGKRVVSISDTHGFQGRVCIPPADLLIIGGDVSPQYSKASDEDIVGHLAQWCEAQPCTSVVVIAGNHDPAFERLGADRVQQLLSAVSKKTRYLCHTQCTVEGLAVYGTPCSYGQAWARGKHASFQRPAKAKESEANLFADVPAGMDIVITHQSAVGCEPLCAVLATAKPRLHVGGHNHASYGVASVDGVPSATVCTVNGKWLPVNLPIVVDL